MAAGMLGMLDLGGTMRVRTPDETIRVVRPLLKSFGITRVANVTGLDCVGVPVWCAVRPFSRSLSVSQGKGISHELAAISAVMEGIELYHGEHCVPEGECCTIAEAIQDSAFIDPLTLPIRSDAKFLETNLVQWILARNEVSGQSTYIPRELLDRDSLMITPKQNLFYSSSNGLASGNTRTEAIIHGLSELVERDQMAFWQVRKELTASGLDTKLNLNTIADPICAELLQKIFAARLEINVWYATTNIEVPTFTCSIWDSEMATPYPHRSGGHGCHPNKRVALLRAITEALQSRLTHISGGRDDMYWSKYRNILPTYLECNRNYLSYIRSEEPNVEFDQIPEAPPFAEAEEMLSWLLKAVLKSAGAECFVVDLSNKSMPFEVVQVVSPGLELSAKRDFYSPGPRMMSYIREIGFA